MGGGVMSADDPNFYPGCSGPCDKGSKDCPTPIACEAVLRHWAAGTTPPERRVLKHDDGTGPSIVLVALCCVIAATVMLAVWLGA